MGEVAVVTANEVVIKTLEILKSRKWSRNSHSISNRLKRVDTLIHAEEIHEQSESIQNACAGRLLKKEAMLNWEDLMESLRRSCQHRVNLCCMRYLWHSALYRRYMLEHMHIFLWKWNTLSEFRYRNHPNKDDVVILISQSGETADTLAALREAKLHGRLQSVYATWSGSSIARESMAAFIFMP